jgi:indolepyruvate decarboxylase
MASGPTTGVTLANELAGRTRRTVTITGDGAFAESLNALGTIAQLGQDPIVFVMDNRVFAVEQWLINADAFCPPPKAPAFAPLTTVPQGHIWDYVKLAEGFGGQGYAVSTNAELSAVLQQIAKPPVNPVTGRPTFTLVAVRLPEKSLPANARWKMTCD